MYFKTYSEHPWWQIKENFLSVIKNETRIPAFTISLQCFTIGPNQWNKANENSRMIGREDMRIFFNDMIVYIKSKILQPIKNLQSIKMDKRLECH